MLPARTCSMSTGNDWRAVYERVWRPEFFPRSASGLAQSDLHREGDAWFASGPEGPVRMCFTEHNSYGLLDHIVETGGGDAVHVPLRIVQNGDGAEVMLTRFRQSGMTGEKFSADAKGIMRDRRALKALVES